MGKPWYVTSGYLLSAAVVVYLALYAGIFRPFTQVYDADLHYLYRALRFNSGLEQKFFDHTGYFYTLVLSWWLKAIHLLGLIPGATLEDVRSAVSPGQVMASAIYAGRIFSILLVLAFLAAVGIGCARLSGSRLFGAAAALLIAPTPGIAYHVITLRPELISALTLALAFLAILLSIDRGEKQRLALLILASGCAHLSVLAKMQAIIPLLFLPLVGLFCRPAERDAGRDGTGTITGPDASCLFLLAIVVFLPFGVSHYFGVTELRKQPFPIYSWAIALYILGCLVAYGRIHRPSAGSTLNAVSAVMIGLGVSYWINYFNLSHSVSATDAAFLDNLKLYGGGDEGLMTFVSFAGIDGYAQFVSIYANKLGAALRSFVTIRTSAQAVPVALALLAAVSAVVVFRAGKKRMAGLIVMLLLAYIGTRTAFLFRSSAPFYEPYFIFFPLFALSLAYAAVGGDGWTRSHRLRALSALGLLVVATLIQGATISRYLTAGTPHVSAERFCRWQRVWAPILRDDDYVDERCWKIYARAIDPRLLSTLTFLR